MKEALGMGIIFGANAVVIATIWFGGRWLLRTLFRKNRESSSER